MAARRESSRRDRSGTTAALRAVLLLAALAALALPADAAAEQASRPTSPAAGQLDVSGGAGGGHTCALLSISDLRCWGFGGSGRLGYGNTSTIGDDETPASAGPVGLGATVKAISAGAYHTCAVLDDGTVRCWGFGGDGRLGDRSTNDIGDDEALGSVGPVDLRLPVGIGPEDRAKAISAGGGHTCAVLVDDTVRCWGFGSDGRLGYGNRNAVGDDETPASVGPVDLRPPVGIGPEDKAKAISAGDSHTCAVLDDDAVRCWGLGVNGQLGYGETIVHGNTLTIGDDETPGEVEPVDLRDDLGQPHTAKAISAGAGHTCAVLDDDSVRCWGYGGNGRLGYGNTSNVSSPGSVGPVDLRDGLGRPHTAKAISTGDSHTCALLEDSTVRCWGYGAQGRLGYATANDIGDDETPGSVGPVDLGPGRTALAISAGGRHTCARLDDGTVRCWGSGAGGRLGYCSQQDIGDDETPGSVGPVDIGGGGAACAAGGGGAPPPPVDTGQGRDAAGAPSGGSSPDPALAFQARRARGLRDCLAGVERRARGGRERVRSRSARARVERRRRAGRRACLKRYGRTPGRVTGLRARAVSKTEIVLSFRAAGTDGSRPPAARAYLVKQSSRPIRGARAFSRAQTLCSGSCRFTVTRVGADLSLTVTDLRPRTAYYYAIEARDNVSGRVGPRSETATARTP